MVADTDPHVIGITESWANKYIVDAELALTCYLMVRRKSKRTFQKKLAGNIKNDSKSFYAYVRNKQKVRDKVGPLKNNSGNIISDGFQMAEVLNEYFS